MTKRDDRPDEVVPDTEDHGLPDLDISEEEPATVNNQSAPDDQSWAAWRDQMLQDQQSAGQQYPAQTRRAPVERPPRRQRRQRGHSGRVTGSAGDSEPNEHGIQSSQYSAPRGTSQYTHPAPGVPTAPSHHDTPQRPSAHAPQHTSPATPSNPAPDTVPETPDQSATTEGVDNATLHTSGISDAQADQDFADLHDDAESDDKPQQKSGWRMATYSGFRVGNMRFGGKPHTRNRRNREDSKPMTKRGKITFFIVFGVVFFGILGWFAYDTITKWNDPINYHGVVQEKLEREVSDRDSDGNIEYTTEYYLQLSGGTSDDVPSNGEYKVNRGPYNDCNVGQHFYQHPVTFRGATCSDVELDVTDDGLVNPDTGDSVEL